MNFYVTMSLYLLLSQSPSESKRQNMHPLPSKLIQDGNTMVDIYYTHYAGSPEHTGPGQPMKNRTHVWHLNSRGQVDYHVNAFPVSPQTKGPNVEDTKTGSVSSEAITLLLQSLDVTEFDNLLSKTVEAPGQDQAIGEFSVVSPLYNGTLSVSHEVLISFPQVRPIIDFLRSQFPL